MSDERVSNRIDLQRLGARLTLAAILSTGFTVAVTTPQIWAQDAQEPASPNQPGQNQAGQSQGRSDADIQSDVAYALSHSKALQGQHITAATVEGDVTVSGNVRDDASKELAQTVIYGVKGVRSVTNNLTVGDAPQANTANAQATDPNTTPEQDLNYDPAQQNMAPGPRPGTGAAGRSAAGSAGLPASAEQRPPVFGSAAALFAAALRAAAGLWATAISATAVDAGDDSFGNVTAGEN